MIAHFHRECLGTTGSGIDKVAEEMWPKRCVIGNESSYLPVLYTSVQ